MSKAVTDQSVLLSCRLAYEAGEWKSVSELARRFGLNLKTLHGRIEREGWKKKREEVSRRVEKKIENKIVSKADQYLSSLQLRVEKYEKIIDASMENLGSKTVEGIPLLDPEAIDQFTRSEGRLQAIGAFAHRVPAISQLDVTSKGESLVAILDRMRADPSKIIDLTADQVKHLSESEVSET